MLINGDKYGSVGSDSKLLSTLASALRLIANGENSSFQLLALQKQTIRNILTERFRRAESRKQRIELFVSDLEKELRTQDDVGVFLLTCENIMIPLNQAIENIPSDDREFTLTIARSYLDVKGEHGLATIINLWDDLGVKGCLTAERTEIVRAFTTLRVLLSERLKLPDEEKDIVLTAFTQEFERRAGQKRKGRAGGSLEDVTQFIFDYYNIKSAPGPEHFQADIEVDNWVKTKDNWLLGISCKRTLRERWKQVSSGEASILSTYRIKYVFHIITFDEDLSDDKIALLGAQRHIFYLPDSSRRLKEAQSNVGLSSYVKPISGIIKDIRREIASK